MLIFCCIKIIPRFTKIQIFSVSVSKESEDLAALFWLRVSHEVLVKMLIRTTDPWSLDFHADSFTHTWQVSAIVWLEVSVAHYKIFLFECPHDRAVIFPEWVIKKRAKIKVTSYNAFYHLLWKFMHIISAMF